VVRRVSRPLTWEATMAILRSASGQFGGRQPLSSRLSPPIRPFKLDLPPVFSAVHPCHHPMSPGLRATDPHDGTLVKNVDKALFTAPYPQLP
jgi:hypothetical protein